MTRPVPAGRIFLTRKEPPSVLVALPRQFGYPPHDSPWMLN